MLVGYLVVGAIMGQGTLGLLPDEGPDIENFAQAGVLLLLFAIGIEFSLEELARLSRFFFVGGGVQMVLVAGPVAGLLTLTGLAWQAALLVSCAVAFSSTVLVFKGLEEWGHSASPHGKRAVGILLFQDVALVPLMLLIPLLVPESGRSALPAGAGELVGGNTWLQGTFLALTSLLFVALVILARMAVRAWIAPGLNALRSVELVVLFALIVLGGAAYGAYAVGLPPALGAFAAGLALNGNRLTRQIDALILPFRETFSAIFFVSLGTLMHFGVVAEQPWMLLATLLGVVALKTGAGTVALRLVGVSWRVAAGTGLGLAQLGEFSFVLLLACFQSGLIGQSHYDRLLFVALATLILTPLLLRWGLGSTEPQPLAEPAERPPGLIPPTQNRAGVVGLGPIGRQVASQLETMGIDVCLIDRNPVNLQPYAQMGFRTTAGDACEPAVLLRADVSAWALAVLTVPDDASAMEVVKLIRRLNSTCRIIVRCRYQASAARMRKAGAAAVVSEEAEASGALLRLLQRD